MKTPSQEDLLGYVLGALDAQEQRDMQQSIDANPEIEEQLLRIKNSLLPLDCLETSGPHPGLARRTCESVAGWQFERSFDSAADRPVSSRARSLDAIIGSAIDLKAPVKSAPKMRSSVTERTLHPRTWSIADMVVGIALIAVMAGILFPTISYTRHNSRVFACQSNLREVGFALMDYGSAHEGQFLVIPPDGNLDVVGRIGPTLKDAGFISDDSLFSCPGIAANCPPVHIPSKSEIDKAVCSEDIDFYNRSMCGHFGFSTGYRVKNRYYPPRAGRTNAVLFADQPSCSPGRVSENHGGKGQNLLFGDGHLKYVIGSAFGGDAIYENDQGVVGPGSNLKDNVIAPSHLDLAPLQGYPQIEVILEAE